MKVRTQLLINNAVILSLFIAVATIAYRGMESLVTTASWVAHTHKVMTNANQLAKDMVDMETGQRGFILTGNDDFLEPYNAGRRVFDENLNATIALVSDNPEQVERLKKVGELITGANSDGAAGLSAIADRGGVTVVEDPETSYASAMPSAAIAATKVDYVRPLEELAPLLTALCEERAS